MDLENLTGTEKAAVLVLSLPQDDVRELLAQLADAEVERILEAVARFDRIPAAVQERVLDEFRQSLGGHEADLAGGRERAVGLARHALAPDRAPLVAERLARGERRIDATLREYEAAFVAQTLADEHPQTLALILAQLPVERGAEVIGALPEGLRTECIGRLAKLGSVSIEVIEALEQGVAELFESRSDAPTRVGGAQVAAKLLNRTSRDTAASILEHMNGAYPELAGEIRKRMLTFSDLVVLDKRAFQTFLREVPTEDLIVALKLASDEMKAKVFSNVSERAAEQMKEDGELLGPMKVSEVEAVQQRIIEIARRLESEGKIRLELGGGDGDLV